MALPNFAVTSDAEVVTAARDKTSYGTEDLPGDENSGQAKGLLDDAKRVLYVKTESSDWYGDLPYGQALVAMTALKFKEAVENINIQSYGIGDEDVRFTNADPDDSQQIIAWSEEINEALAKSDVNFAGDKVRFKNTASYIG